MLDSHVLLPLRQFPRLAEGGVCLPRCSFSPPPILEAPPTPPWHMGCLTRVPQEQHPCGRPGYKHSGGLKLTRLQLITQERITDGDFASRGQAGPKGTAG